MSGEAIERFACFGSHCAVHVTDAGGERYASQAAREARVRLEAWHGRFSRFLSGSELSRLNEDPRPVVPVSPMMARLAVAVREAGELTGGLVDGTLAREVAAAGYAGEIGEPLALRRALALAPARRAAGPSPSAGWRSLVLGEGRRSLARPPGVCLDSGGLAKGLFADAIAASLAPHAGFAVDCAGDLALGGADRAPREVHVESPFDGSTLHTFHVSCAGVATSGIGRRAWLDGEQRPCHHLLDPATGRPAFTGIVQVTALAPTALRAEILAKAALLAGPAGAARRLRHGGVIVLDDGSHVVHEPPASIGLPALAPFRRRPRPPQRAPGAASAARARA